METFTAWRNRTGKADVDVWTSEVLVPDLFAQVDKLEAENARLKKEIAKNKRLLWALWRRNANLR